MEWFVAFRLEARIIKGCVDTRRPLCLALFLTQTTDCRIFQDKSVVEIIEQVFQDLGFQDYHIGHLIGEHPKRNYCVQYRESDFEFVSRLMEEEGLFYFFEHQNGKHLLHLADSVAAYRDCSESSVDYPHTELVHRAIRPHIIGWEHVYQFKAGAWAHTDFNFKKPRVRLMADEKTLMKFSNVSKFEMYDFPGEYRAKGCERVRRVRMEELELDHDMVSGSSYCRSFSPGHRFTVGRHQSPQEEGKSFVLKRVHHLAERTLTRATPALEPGLAYVNEFECFRTRQPSGLPEPLQAGRARLPNGGCHGPPMKFTPTLTVGSKQFHWDRGQKRMRTAPCWIRVSQIHAGNGWGYMDIPRIGEEVIVDFMEEIPTSPLSLEGFTTETTGHPTTYPKERLAEATRPRPTKAAATMKCPWMTPGMEQIRIHGQHNMDTEILNDETHTVHNNRTKNVGVDESMTIGNNQTLDVGVNKSVSVGTNHDEQVGSNQSIRVGSTQTVNIGSKQSISIGKTKNESVGMISNEMVGATKTTNVGAVYSIVSGAAMNTAVGFISAEEVGMTKKIIVGSKLEIIVGASKLVMEAGGKVTIEGTEFLFSACGNKINGSIIDLN